MLINNPPVKITDDLMMLGSAEYPLYLLRGHTIVEGGVGSMAPLLGEQLDSLSIPRDAIRQAVVMHGHPDHVMALPAFREMFPGIRFLASELAAATLQNEKAVGFFRQIDDTLTASLTKAGTIAERHHPKPLAENKIAVDATLKEGDTLDIDGAAFAVLQTPGHSDCSLSLHQPESGLLLISDVSGYYMPSHDCWWANYFSGYAAYMNSMRRLAQLDAEVLCLGHLAVIRGAEAVRTYFDRAIAATEQCHQQIVAETKAGKSGREIAAQIGAEVYEKTQLMPLEFMQKNSSLLVKQSLKHEGIEPKP